MTPDERGNRPFGPAFPNLTPPGLRLAANGPSRPQPVICHCLLPGRHKIFVNRSGGTSRTGFTACLPRALLCDVRP
jgi:hypothetical protein